MVDAKEKSQGIPGPDDPSKGDRRLALSVIALLTVVGFVFYLLFCIQSAQPCWKLGAGGVLASAAFASGSLFGLLFGIPPPRRGAEVLETNSSLQQVSEWLTKVILGASLTQVTNLPRAIARFGDHFGNDVGGRGIAISLLVHFIVTGFISGYLFTRLFLQHAFYRADATPLPGRSVVPSNTPELLPNPQIHASPTGVGKSPAGGELIAQRDAHSVPAAGESAPPAMSERGKS